MSQQIDMNDHSKRLSSIADLSILQAKELLEAQAITAVMDCIETDSIAIPLIGTLHIKHTDDITDAEGKKAILECNFEPDPFLRKSIGQAADGVATEADELYRKKTESQLMKSIGD